MVNLVSRSAVGVLLALCARTSPRAAKVRCAAAINLSTVGEEQQQAEEAQGAPIEVPSFELGKSQLLPLACGA